ncbi:MAG: hypothetical protein K5907_08440 [Treponema sp.]|nr:hypothetical protein [Treponema sp.]
MIGSKLKEKLKHIFVVGAEAAVLVTIVVLSAAPVSCKITEQGITILNGDYTPPVLNGFTVIDEKTVRLEFSEKVEVSGYVVARITDELFSSEEHSQTLDLSPALERASGVYGALSCKVLPGAEPGILEIVLDQDMQVGQSYEFYSEVHDSSGNSLTIAIPFTGYNSRVPELLITEIQTESVGQRKTEEDDNFYRNEFIELLALKGGNLAGLELCSAYDGETKKYVFPVVEVAAGEVFVVHMRKRGNGCVSELGDNLAAATNTYSSPQIRDLWTDIETTTLGNKTDIILLRNTADKKLLDAVMYRASNIEAWAKKMIDFSSAVDESGIYDSGDVENAFITDEMTASKTMSRKDAAAIRERVLAGEQIEYPVKSGPQSWEVLTEGTPGSL